MSEGWRLTLRERPPLPIEVGALIPERLANVTRAELERLPLALGRSIVPLAELFRVEGGPGARLVFAGACERLDGIGRGLAAGEIVVDGDAGHEVAAGQSAGEIRVAGSVADHGAMGMRGGVLGISGSAGAFLGSAPPGERLGLRGGLVAVAGSVGARAGDRMRRGMMLIAGDAGAACGARMVAGTIAVAGRLGPLPGLRMRRGTIIAGGAPEGAPDTFADTGPADLTIFKLLGRKLGMAAPWLEPLLTAAPLRRLAGDLAVDGKGEILLAPTGSATPKEEKQ
jgi:formylmethanofuran dehydrogenase subunit C